MRPSALLQALRVLVKVNQAGFLHGPPGVGKSDLVRELAADLGWTLTDVRAVLLDPVDLRGLPMLDQLATADLLRALCESLKDTDGDFVRAASSVLERLPAKGQGKRATWAPPAFLPSGEAPSILFLDELPQAPVSVQNACLQLTLDRRLGEYQLPKECRIIAAGNRSTDRAGAGKLTTALASRFVHLDLDVSHDDWMTWARTHGIHETVRACLAFRPALLFDFDPAVNAERFPCPRTWAFASELYRELVNQDAMGLELDVIGGAVGPGAAAEFVAFSRIFRDLPDPEEVLKDPKGATVPTSPPVLFALSTAIGARAEKLSAAMLDNLVTYVDRLPAEFQVLTMRDAIAVRPDLLRHAAVAKWVQRNHAVLGLA